MDDIATIPELGDAQYCTEVMHLPVDISELEHDRQLLSKAHRLGIMASLPSVAEQAASSSTSVSTESTSRDNTFSTFSDGSASAYLTPHSSIYGKPSIDLSSVDASIKSPSKALSFSPYEKYLAQVEVVNERQRFRKTSLPVESSGQSIFSVSTRKSLSGATTGFRSRMRLKKKPTRIFEPPISCLSCRLSFDKSTTLQRMPCGHAYCSFCLKDMATKAVKDETKMPPSCCTQPVPAEALQNTLDIETQERFLKAVVQYTTPLGLRVFCSNSSCGEYIPPLKKVDPHMPLAVTCRRCQTKVCSTCKKDAHSIGTLCPGDWELEDALKICGEGSWRRCYRCRKLVELNENLGPATCSCNAQFCRACGGVWDISTGCPNVCHGNAGLAHSIQAESQSSHGSETGRPVLQLASEQRSATHPDMVALQLSQEKEMRRLLAYMSAADRSMQARHSAQELALKGQQSDAEAKTNDKHAKAASQLEDRQIAEELDLRTTLDQAARSINARIKHMEAYCDGAGNNPNGGKMPPRVVTEQNLRDLGNQYTLRDDMDRQHQSRINMMRDRQSKRMEELLEKHEAELEKLSETQQRDRDDFKAKTLQEQELFDAIFESRQARLTARWNLTMVVLCRELQAQEGVTYAAMSAPSWPEKNPIAIAA